MNNYIARANIDHFLDMLHNHEVPVQDRATITKLLVEEEDKLSHDQEQLQFAESKAAACRDRADHQRRMMDSFDHGSTDWELAEKLLVNFESLAQFVESFCLQMRSRVKTEVSFKQSRYQATVSASCLRLNTCCAAAN